MSQKRDWINEIHTISVTLLTSVADPASKVRGAISVIFGSQVS